MKCKRMHVFFLKIDTCKISVYNFRIYVERLYLKTKWNQNNCSEAFIMFTSYWTVTSINAHNYESGEIGVCFVLHAASVGGWMFRKWLFNYVNPLVIQFYEIALW